MVLALLATPIEPPTTPRRRSIGVRILVFLALVLLPVGLAEFMLRLLDPGNYAELLAREHFSAQIGERRMCVLHLGSQGTRERSMVRLKSNVNASLKDMQVVTDSHGMRTPPFVVPKLEGSYRIILLGDSLPFGWGVAEAEIFPRILERKLAIRSDRRFEVVNAASPGWGLDDQWQWLREEGFALEPDMILHCMSIKDTTLRPHVNTLLPYTLRGVYLLRLVESLWMELMSLRAQWSKSIVTISGEQLCFAVDLMHTACSEHEVAYVLLDTNAIPQVVQHCKSKNYRRLDVFLSHAWLSEHQVSAADTHPNAAGHRHIADEVYRQLDPQLDTLLLQK